MKAAKPRGGKRKEAKGLQHAARDRGPLLAMAALSVLALLAYSNSFQAGFTLDNKGLLLEDPRLREASWANLHLILQHTYWWPYGESGLYRPFTTLSYLLNYAILGNGARPAGYHWINLLLHTGNVLLVYALARRLAAGFWAAVFIAGLWGVHPVLTESVTNIIGRADLLAGMSVLAGLLLYMKATEADGWRRISWLLALAAVSFAGMFSKESAVVIPGVITLYELAWWRERRQVRGLLLGWLAVTPALLALWYRRSVVLAAAGPASFPFVENPVIGADFWTAKLTAAKVLARYLGLLVWPARLSADYSYPQIPLASGSLQDWVSWTAVAVVAAAAITALRWNPVIFLAAGFAFVNLLPASNLLFPIGTIMAERFLYLPAVGLSVCMVLGAYSARRWIRWPAFAPVVLGVVIAGFAARTWIRNADWRDELTLATASVRTSPESHKTHRWLAAALYESDLSRSNIDPVIAEAEKSLAPLQQLPDVHNSAATYEAAGIYYLEKGDRLLTRGPSGEPVIPPESESVYKRALEVLVRAEAIVKAGHRREQERGAGPSLTARYANLYQRLAQARIRLGDKNAALEAARQARALDPFSPEMHQQVAEALIHLGRGDEAAIALMAGEMITSDPGIKEAMVSLYRSGVDLKGCAAVETANGWMIDPSCETVRKHICPAAAEAAQLHRQAGREDFAVRTMELVREFGCGGEPAK
jgi:hypothetical protein